MVSYKYIDITLTLQVLLFLVSFLPLVIFLSLEFSFLLCKRIIHIQWLRSSYSRRTSPKAQQRRRGMALQENVLRWFKNNEPGFTSFDAVLPCFSAGIFKEMTSSGLCELGQSGFVLWSSKLILRKCHSFFDPDGEIQWVCRHWREAANNVVYGLVKNSYIWTWMYNF
ncbi:hypothetical protein POTOM_011014 [Populus tomentosa]|uniref:Uncharacterized protein n=1 Tax=Populus tomentosa TaxID=118781 RepID=A0A8X8DCW2_POPTO|nr:hypothetical protein POTOM_011014 [Populus tomentosa]